MSMFDMTQPLMGVDGEPITEPPPIDPKTRLPQMDDEGEPVLGEEIILRTILSNALGATLASDQGKSGEDKAKIWELAVRLQKDRPDLTPEEVVLIKQRVGEAFGPMIVGPTYMILNGTPAPEPAKDEAAGFDGKPLPAE